MEPLAGQTSNANTKLGTIAAHGVNQGAVLNTLDGIHGALAGGHGEVQPGVVVGVQELESTNLDILIEVSLNNGGSQLTDQQGSTSAVTVVAVVAHLQLLSDENLQVDLAADFQSFLDDGIELIAQPVQTSDNGLIIGTETQNLAQTLIEGAVSHVAIGLVDYFPNRHGVGNDTAHGANSVVMMAGIEGDLAGSSQFLSLFGSLCQTLIDESADNSTLGGVTHILPGYGRAGVQDGLFGHAGDVFASSANADQSRLSAQNALQSFGISGIDFLAQCHCFFLLNMLFRTITFPRWAGKGNYFSIPSMPASFLLPPATGFQSTWITSISWVPASFWESIS